MWKLKLNNQTIMTDVKNLSMAFENTAFLFVLGSALEHFHACKSRTMKTMTINSKSVLKTWIQIWQALNIIDKSHQDDSKNKNKNDGDNPFLPKTTTIWSLNDVRHYYKMDWNRNWYRNVEA